MRKEKYNIEDFVDNIPDFPGYHVTNSGKVFSRRSVKKGLYYNFWREKKIVIDNIGRCNVALRDCAGKVHNKRVHRLVLEAFIGECPDNMECCHNDGNASNNLLSNLRWDTSKSNKDDLRKHGRLAMGERSGTAKLTESDVLNIKSLRDKGMRMKEISALYGVHPPCISRIINGKRWKHLITK